MAGDLQGMFMRLTLCQDTLRHLKDLQGMFETDPVARDLKGVFETDPVQRDLQCLLETD